MKALISVVIGLCLSSPAFAACELSVTSTKYGTQIVPWTSASQVGQSETYKARVRGGSASYVASATLDTETGSYSISIRSNGVEVAAESGILQGIRTASVPYFIQGDSAITVVNVVCGASL